MVHVQDRSKVFKDAFKKMINETLRDKERINRLIAEREGVNSSCMFSEIRVEEERGDENNKEVMKECNVENDQDKKYEGRSENMEVMKECNVENDQDKKYEDGNVENRNEDHNNKPYMPGSLNDATDLITILKHNLSQSFKTLLIQSSITPSLSNLSELINQNIINRRDIKNEDYVKEVFGSYGAQHKRVLVSTLSAMMENMRHRVQGMKERVGAVCERMGRVDERRARVEERYVEMYKRFGDVLH